MKQAPRPLTKLKITLLALGILLALAVLLFTQYQLGGGGIESPTFNLQAILLAVLTVMNVLFILVLVLVLARYLVKTFFEKRERTVFASVKTKLTLALLALAIVPTGLFVFLAYTVINRSISQWFSAPAEEILRHSEELARSYYITAIDNVRGEMADFRSEAARGALTWEDVTAFRQRRRLDAVLLLDARGRVRREDTARPDRGQAAVALKDPALVVQNVRLGEIAHFVENHPDRDVVVCFAPSPWNDRGILVFLKALPGSVAYRSYLIIKAYQEYFRLRNQVELLRWQYLLIVSFAGISLLFAFVWFGIYISKQITGPVEALIEGSQRVAARDWSRPIEWAASDEFGTLVQSFNRMMGELARSQEAIEQANAGLTRMNRELAERNTFIQTVLDSVATGVVSVDADLRITSSNSATRHLLKQRRVQDGATYLREVIPPEKMPELQRLLQEAEFHQRVSREITFETGKRTMHFAVTASAMRDAEGRVSGYVVVFDDVSDLIRTEKAAAWQEVAKRLAHEIKNPLTPIQLFVERIRKQFGRLQDAGALPGNDSVSHFRQLLDDGLATVQTETGNLKYLVEEFSRFARLPNPVLLPVNLNQLVEEAAAAFRVAHPERRVETDMDPGLPPVYLDRELIRLVINNLLRNAADAVAEEGGDGRITVATAYREESRRVHLSVEDEGRGLADEHWENLFLPYFSTKKEGMGLGLTIVKKILDDHEAAVRAEPVQPHGCRFVVEFTHLRTPEET